MKILIFTDNHFCEKSSIVQKFGTKYTTRLENQITSVNWLEQLAIDKNCDAVICLGDFFDKPELTDQEITAIKDLKWNNLHHYFLVGNHESTNNDLQFNSTKILESDLRTIISDPKMTTIDDCELCFLPYIIESDRHPLAEYFPKQVEGHRRIILSHNDIKGIQMGPVVSRTGFEIEDIEKSCDLFLNGHLHNGQWVSKKALNLGNLTGKDFGEDALKHAHNILILDTETLKFETIENPFAFNFYKLIITTENDLKQLSKLKNNGVLSIKCNDKLNEQVTQILSSLTTVIAHRLILFKEITTSDSAELDISDLTVDHLAKFIECCHQNIDNGPMLEAELAEICK